MVGPEALQSGQCLVELVELLNVKSRDLLHGKKLAVVEGVNALADDLALGRELHPHRAFIGVGALVVNVALLHQFLEIVGHVRALVVAAGFQLPRSQFGVGDIEQQQRLHRIYFLSAVTVKIILDQIKQAPVKALNQGERLHVAALDRIADRFRSCCHFVTHLATHLIPCLSRPASC